MLCPHSEHDGEILFLITVWTLLSLFGAWWGDSLTRHHAPNDYEMSSLGRVREFPTMLQMTREHGGEILLLASGWTSLIVVRHRVGRCPTMRRTTMKDVQPGASKRISPSCSVVIIQSVVRRFLTCPFQDISRRRLAHGGE